MLGASVIDRLLVNDLQSGCLALIILIDFSLLDPDSSLVASSGKAHVREFFQDHRT
jgi:hypothetical protein